VTRYSDEWQSHGAELC